MQRQCPWCGRLGDRYDERAYRDGGHGPHKKTGEMAPAPHADGSTCGVEERDKMLQTDPSQIRVCKECGSQEIEVERWVKVNDEANVREISGDTYWCPTCLEHRHQSGWLTLTEWGELGEGE